MMTPQITTLSGSVISGRYQIMELLGQGGMAHVYLALDQKTGGQVAVKFMREDLENDEEFINHFESETHAASGLNHPNIVRVLGFGRDHDKRYIVQEYVAGSSLKELILAEGAIPWQSALPMAIQIGLALEHAHKNGVVHRDIKPHNILVTKDRIAKVTDFGIARLSSANMLTLTSGVAYGSVHYFSPEQARGTIVGDKSDIYSLGILMYELVTGHVPFDGETAVSVAIKHLQEIPPRPSLTNSMIPRGLDQIIMKCIQKSPDNRYRDVRELIDELDAFIVDPNGVYGVVDILPDRDGQTTALQILRQDPNYNKLREIEQLINVRRHARNRDSAIVLGIILVAIIFVTSIGVWGWRMISSTIQDEPTLSYELENYIGRDLKEVLEILKKEKIASDVVYAGNSSVIVGLIIDQSPGSGIFIKPNSTTLKLTVSGGPDQQLIADQKGQISIKTPMVTMPNCVGQSFTTARSQLMMLNLVLGPVVSIAGNVAENNRIVIRQNVKAGSKIAEQTVVSFTYGTAQDYANYLNPSPTPAPFIFMTDLDRISLISARTMFALQGLTSLNISYASEESRLLPESQLYVMTQSPIAGEQVVLTSNIHILVGSNAEYNAFKNPTPTPAETLMPTPTPVPTPIPSSAPSSIPSPILTPRPTVASSPTSIPTNKPTPTPSPVTEL